MENRNYLLYAWIGERGLHLGGISFLSQGGEREGVGRSGKGGYMLRGRGRSGLSKSWGNGGIMGGIRKKKYMGGKQDKTSNLQSKHSSGIHNIIYQHQDQVSNPIKSNTTDQNGLR